MSRRFMLNLVWVLFLGSACTAVSADDGAEKKTFVAPQTETEPKNPTDYEVLIDSLTNRKNQAPVLVAVKGNYIYQVPVFLEEYDDQEQRRILNVVRTMHRYPGNELWPHLLAHQWDTQYALTYQRVTKKHMETVINYSTEQVTVGHICRDLEFQLKNYPCQKHLPTRATKKDQRVRGIPKFPLPKNMATWGKGKPESRLDEVQSEMCQFMLDHPDQLTGMSDEERSVYVENLRRELETLRRTKNALMPESLHFEQRAFSRGQHVLFSPQEIAELRARFGDVARKRLEEQKQEMKEKDSSGSSEMPME